MIGALLLYTITNEDLSKEFTAALTRQQWIHEPDQSTYYYPYSLTEIDLANFQQWPLSVNPPIIDLIAVTNGMS